MNLNQSLAVVGKLTQRELNVIRAEVKALDLEMQQKVDDGFHPDRISVRDIEHAKYFGVRFVANIAKRGDYCAFWNDAKEQLKSSKMIVEQRFPDLPCQWNAKRHNDHRHFYSSDPFIFQGYYAMEHDDRSIDTTHQLMLILANGGHRLYSEDGNVLLTPKAGDIVVLCTHKKHAVYPCATKNAAHCATSPLKLYAVPFFPTPDTKQNASK